MMFIGRKCVVCHERIEGRSDKRTCSDRCRMALNRAEQAVRAAPPGAKSAPPARAAVTEPAAVTPGQHTDDANPDCGCAECRDRREFYGAVNRGGWEPW